MPTHIDDVTFARLAVARRAARWGGRLGLLCGGVLGTLVFPLVGTIVGGLIGMLVGLVFGAVNGVALVRAFLGRWPLILVSVVCALLSGTCAELLFVTLDYPISGGTPVLVGCVLGCAAFGAVLGPMINVLAREERAIEPSEATATQRPGTVRR